MKVFNVVLAAAFVSGLAAAYATEKAIHQKGKVFSESEITVKVGDSLLFVNDDNIIHNVMSTTEGHKFNLGPMKPGNATPVTFKNAGEVKVLCAIHPPMRMTVKVVQ
ncbi:MAG: plastocyanin/azurin family copper-binding protein [Pseudolabrys sp.]